MIDPGNSQKKNVSNEALEQEPSVAPTPDEGSAEATEMDRQEESTTATDSVVPARRSRRRVKKERALTEEEMMPHPSYWPVGLAISLAIMLVGLVTNPILLGVGVLMVIGSVIGWSLERR